VPAYVSCQARLRRLLPGGTSVLLILTLPVVPAVLTVVAAWLPFIHHVRLLQLVSATAGRPTPAPG
jgi:membrane protein YqaA with SNARE-associated domain